MEEEGKVEERLGQEAIACAQNVETKYHTSRASHAIT